MVIVVVDRPRPAVQVRSSLFSLLARCRRRCCRHWRRPVSARPSLRARRVRARVGQTRGRALSRSLRPLAPSTVSARSVSRPGSGPRSPSFIFRSRGFQWLAERIARRVEMSTHRTLRTSSPSRDWCIMASLANWALSSVTYVTNATPRLCKILTVCRARCQRAQCRERERERGKRLTALDLAKL